MTLIEVQKAFLEHCPIVLNQSGYDYITEIHFRKVGDPTGLWRLGWDNIPASAKQAMKLIEYYVTVADEEKNSSHNCPIEYVSWFDPKASTLSDEYVAEEWKKLFTPQTRAFKRAFFDQLPITLGNVHYDFIDKMVIQKVLDFDRPWEWDGKVRLLVRPYSADWSVNRLAEIPIEQVQIEYKSCPKAV